MITLKYECKLCGNIITSQSIPTKCLPPCEGTEFNFNLLSAYEDETNQDRKAAATIITLQSALRMYKIETTLDFDNTVSEMVNKMNCPKELVYEALRRAGHEREKLKVLPKQEINSQTRPEVVLPSTGKLDSDFAQEVADVLRNKEVIFFRPSSREVLEISLIKEKERQEEYIGFSAIKPERFITLSENYIKPCAKIQTKYGLVHSPKSMRGSTASVLLHSPQLQNSLPKIRRIFPSPIPILYNGELTFPKKGYDPRFESWMPPSAPDIDPKMSLETAKALIHEIYKEFCFQERQDYINAISGLLTPFLRGIFPKFSERTPVYLYIANRERAGKDYCAAITGIVHEGYSLEEPPISNGESSGNTNEELRKKILSAFMAGRRRLHFANNKGYIDNAVFEGIITSEKYSDRALGRNEILTFDNEIDFSLSGNVGIGFTPDLNNRARMVRLFLDIEDANAREFTNPNLHKWVKDNRGKILSALYSMVRNWIELDSPEGKTHFASFPEWARICGGIMEAAGYDSPCKTDKSLLSMGGDTETSDMKALFELCFEKFPDTPITKQQIRDLVNFSEDGIFGYFDFTRKADQTKFGLKIIKFVGRVLSNITLRVEDSSVRAARQRYIFTKASVERDQAKIFGELVTSGNDGNIHNPSYSDKEKDIIDIETLPTLPTLPSTDEEVRSKDILEVQTT